MPLRLVATDLDGTLLRSDLSVSARTRAALDAVRAAGIPVVPVTARQPEGMRDVAEATGFDGWALCSNGALGIHLGTGEVLFESAIAPTAQRALVTALDAAVPGLVYASVRDRGETFLAEPAYAATATYADHKRDPESMTTGTRAAVLDRPSLKFIVRHPGMDAQTLWGLVGRLAVPGLHLTRSGAPFVEVQPEGADKASGLTRLCREWGVAQQDVVAFGDAPNDASMLAWAGHAVAVAGACEEVLAVSDEVTADNDDDGVARVLERLLDGADA
ncbi:Cof-type HAD-IIB family hydrolase [Nocardioides panacisoli]|uniref:HAD family hydrolase n=1 Tax=Nocardioides panacisoli TaxID=627624 RepID=UPI001C628437|nr:HAD family hydrolase [Nocardioides panacisoli]QYJ02619.1 Cof-type HAD-IIB family hydrolase [Nocardioides panacisoli]